MLVLAGRGVASGAVKLGQVQQRVTALAAICTRMGHSTGFHIMIVVIVQHFCRLPLSGIKIYIAVVFHGGYPSRLLRARSGLQARDIARQRKAEWTWHTRWLLTRPGRERLGRKPVGSVCRRKRVDAPALLRAVEDERVRHEDLLLTCRTMIESQPQDESRAVAMGSSTSTAGNWWPLDSLARRTGRCSPPLAPLSLPRLLGLSPPAESVCAAWTSWKRVDGMLPVPNEPFWREPTFSHGEENGAM